MSDITLRSDFHVTLVNVAGNDDMICNAARVSVHGFESADPKGNQGLIEFLMKNRHGSPFEHGLMTFRIEAPIFVWREFMRHRIGFSYNEQSGRYMEMRPEFYIPDPGRPLIQKGKPGAYQFVAGERDQYELMIDTMRDSYQISWSAYQLMLQAGIAKEVARMTLPVATYSSAYVTCNPRSLMSFLSLRTRDTLATFPSYPQWEIEQVTFMMEDRFCELWPLTARSFSANGRVAP